MVTPFLKSINKSGGSLYVFPSASKDLTRTLVSNDYEFKFSHFACLNLPNFSLDSKINGEDKGMYLGNLLKSTQSYSDSYDINSALVEHLQNYVMNFETAILNGEGDNDDYDNDILTTVSEKVFFNWLQKVGGIEFNDNIEKYSDLSERTIPYIGNIDVLNTVEINGDSFEELYIHIPSDAGASTSVYFRDGSMTDNKNYLNKDYPIGTKNETVIIGRTAGTYPYDPELSISPIVDDENENVYKGDIGHTIDFRDSSYADGSGISTMNAESTNDFEFNAILIYYDFLEKSTSTGTKKLATNLYGILFLEEVTNNSGDSDGDSDNDRTGYIQRYPKIKETIYGNGNSFALKIDLKIDTIPDTTSVKITYQDPNSAVAMSLYEKSLTQLQKCIDMFYEQKTIITNLKERVNTLECLLSGIDAIDNLKGEIDRLYELYDGTSTVDNETLLGLIEVNSNKLDSIMQGDKDVKLQYDTDVLQAGTGVSLDKSLNKVVINASQGYAINKLYSDSNYTNEITSEYPLTSTSSSLECYLKLKSGENLGVLYINDEGTYTSTLDIYINDDDCSWKVGQTLKIFLKSYDEDTTLNLKNSYGLNLHIGDTIKEEIYSSDLDGVKSIELVCVNDEEFVYQLTK